MSKSDIKNKQIEIQINTHNLNKNKKEYVNGIFSAQVDFFLIWNLSQIHHQDFFYRSIDNSHRKLTWYQRSIPIMQLGKAYFVCPYMTYSLESKMEDQDRGFRRGRGGRRRERGFRDRPARVKIADYIMCLWFVSVFPLITHYPLYKYMGFGIL